MNNEYVIMALSEGTDRKYKKYEQLFVKLLTENTCSANIIARTNVHSKKGLSI